MQSRDRSLGVINRKIAPDGCFDLGYDDFAEGDPFKMFQEIALRDDKQQSKI
jgi:hypothetical protein